MAMVALLGGLVGVAADRWISAGPNVSSAPIAAAPTSAGVPTSVAPAATVGTAPRVGPRARGQNGGGAAPTATPSVSSGAALLTIAGGLALVWFGRLP